MTCDCSTCCHQHRTDTERCIIYKDGLCRYMYRLCHGRHYADRDMYRSVDLEIYRLMELRKTSRVMDK